MDEVIFATTMEPPQLLILGVLLLVGWFAHAIGSYAHVPRVTLLLLFGIIAGPSVLNVIPSNVVTWFPHVAHLALAMVGFLLGESFAGREIKESGRVVLIVSVGVVLGSATAVFVVALLLQVDLVIALLLAGIATATAPAATLDVIREAHTNGPLTKTVIGVVAIDDAWGVMLFSFLLVLAEGLAGHGTPLAEIGWGLWEVLGAIVVGVGIGFPMAWFTGRIKSSEPTLLEAAGFVFLCGGLALMLHVSYLLACMVLGATVANRAKHYTRPFREIDGALEPFLAMFFLLAGYECDLAAVQNLGIIGTAYVMARSIGRIVTGRFTARLAGATPIVQSHIGWCLLPQAGIALGLALLVSERLPEVGETILPLTIATTVVFELAGPLLTRWHLHQAGE